MRTCEKRQDFHNWIEIISILWEKQRYRLNGDSEGKSSSKSEFVQNAREAAIDELSFWAIFDVSEAL